MARVLELQLQHQSFQRVFKTDFLWDGLVGSPCCPTDSQESSRKPQFKRSTKARPNSDQLQPQLLGSSEQPDPLSRAGGGSPSGPHSLGYAAEFPSSMMCAHVCARVCVRACVHVCPSSMMCVCVRVCPGHCVVRSFPGCIPQKPEKRSAGHLASALPSSLTLYHHPHPPPCPSS